MLCVFLVARGNQRIKSQEYVQRCWRAGPGEECLNPEQQWNVFLLMWEQISTQGPKIWEVADVCADESRDAHVIFLTPRRRKLTLTLISVDLQIISHHLQFLGNFHFSYYFTQVTQKYTKYIRLTCKLYILFHIYSQSNKYKTQKQRIKNTENNFS